MNKYARTKDEIIKLDEKGCIKELVAFGKKRLFAFKDKKYSHRFENGKEVIKQADTIEELCDEFIVIGYYKNRPLHFDTLLEAQKFVYENGCQDKDYIEIKGAIWTDKGLIYVKES